MKLRRVEINGFKSFRQRVTIDIADGVTAIVGPNGCGKSNVVDAIKWAMGEMSAKSLRGASMEDVIFSGSERFKPSGLAEVTLTFENNPESWDEVDTEHSELPTQFRDVAEISITRRLFRSGDSEYLINKTACRLMDVQNLLAGTGVGKQGYSIIEQNQVGFVVGAKPQERRLLIEEASGITRYKSQRERAERKLNRTEDNLLRVDDLLREVERQIGSLKRQAKRAAQHRLFTTELLALDVAIIVDRRDEAEAARRKHTHSQTTATERLQTVELQVAAAAERLDGARHGAQAAEERHASATESFYRIDTRLNLAKSRLEHATATKGDVERRLVGLRADREREAGRGAELVTELEALSEESSKLADSSALDQALQDASVALEAAETDVRKLRIERDEAVRQRQSLEIRQARMDERVNRAEERASEAAEREQELNAQIAELAGTIEAATDRLKGATDASDAVADRTAQLTDTVETATSALAESDAALLVLREALDEAARRRTALESKLDSLRAVRDAGTGYGGGTEAVLKWAKKHDRSDVGRPLGEYLDPDDPVLTVVAAERLRDVVVTSVEAAQEAAAACEGRQAFQLIKTLDAAPKLVAKFAKQWMKDATQLDEASARLSDGRIVFGTDPQTGAMMNLLAELQAAETEWGDADAAFQSAHDALDAGTKALAESRQKAQLAQNELRTAELDAVSKRSERAAAELELQRVTDARTGLGAQLLPLFKLQEELEQSKKANEEERCEIRRLFEKFDAQLEGVAPLIPEADGRVTDARDVAQKATFAVSQNRQARQHLQQTHNRLSQASESSIEMLARTTTEIDRLSDRLVELETTIVESGAEVTSAGTERTTSQSTMAEARAAVDAANAGVADLELAVRMHRDAQMELSAEVREYEAARRETEVTIEHLDEQLTERFSVDVTAARELAGAVETPRAQRAPRRDELRKKLERLGAVNAMAEEEFEEATERQAFLAEQRTDLDLAIADLRSAINKMDRESRRRFAETFEAVNAKFKVVFPELFRGGKAELVLTEPDDLLRTGVDIVVQPPGKRLQNVTLLSGGEKALTAVSLIFSIFMLKPAPFSILDEVDAPLDEANVDRFARMVRQLSEHSQMLLITHSRRSMEYADVLYGVTMEEPGISKLVSVRLSEVDERLAS